MKKIILLASMLLSQIILSTNTFAQINASDSLQTKEEILQKDQLESVNQILGKIETNTYSPENYKLYPTTNIWTFIKLDTRNGKLWQVQFDNSGDDRFEVPINTSDLTFGENKALRFELYPTQNIYTFLLLDKLTGKVWQAQWSTKRDNRFIIPIR